MSRKNKREQVYIVRFGTHSVSQKASVIAIDHKHAERIAKKFPNVKSVAKAQRDYDRITNSEFARKTMDLVQDIAQPKMTPLAMDEFLWLRRRNRINNKRKDRLDR